MKNNKILIALILIVSAVFLLSSKISIDPPTKEEYTSVDYQSPVPIRDTLKALQFGAMAFHLGCEGCHNVAKAGFSNVKDPIGLAGEFDLMYQHIKPDHFVDRNDLRTPPTICSENNLNALTGGELGFQGLNADIDREKLLAFKNQNNGNKGVYVQVDVALEAHNLDPITEILREDEYLSKLANEAFYIAEVNNDVTIAGIGMYEISMTPYRSNFAKSTRGESMLEEPKGYELYLEKCSSCHGIEGDGHNAIALKVGESDFVGRIRATKDPRDLNMVKATQMYNLTDAPCYFHNCQDVTLYRAIKRCASTHDVEIRPSEIHSIKRMLKKDMHDPELERFYYYFKSK